MCKDTYLNQRLLKPLLGYELYHVLILDSRALTNHCGLCLILAHLGRVSEHKHELL